MNSPEHYNARLYQLPKEFLLSLHELKPYKTYIALASTWFVLIALVLLGRFAIPSEHFLLFYIPTIFLIAGRFGSLLQLVHEAAHDLISKNRKLNDSIATWLCSLPVGVFYDGYTKGHMQHHAFTGTEKDPLSDREKYRVTDCRSPKLYLLFLKDLLGITALSVFFAYKGNDDEVQNKTKKEEAGTSRIYTLMILCFVQMVILGLLFQFNIKDYILFWLIPAVSPHMFLMRIRGIAEHGLARQVGVSVDDSYKGTLYTRSFFTKMNHYRFTPLIWLERVLIGSLNVNHHHEHHLFPAVPFYHLKELNARIGPLVAQQNPDVYVPGYFSTTIFNLTHRAPQSLSPALDGIK